MATHARLTGLVLKTLRDYLDKQSAALSLAMQDVLSCSGCSAAAKVMQSFVLVPLSAIVGSGPTILNQLLCESDSEAPAPGISDVVLEPYNA